MCDPRPKIFEKGDKKAGLNWPLGTLGRCTHPQFIRTVRTVSIYQHCQGAVYTVYTAYSSIAPSCYSSLPHSLTQATHTRTLPVNVPQEVCLELALFWASSSCLLFQTSQHSLLGPPFFQFSSLCSFVFLSLCFWLLLFY